MSRGAKGRGIWSTTDNIEDEARDGNMQSSTGKTWEQDGGHKITSAAENHILIVEFTSNFRA